MTRPRHPGRPVRAALPFLLLLLVLPAAPARAQEHVEPDSPVSFTLVAQSPFAAADRPFRAQVQGTNVDDDSLDNLTLSLTIYHAMTSRTAYDISLTEEPPVAPLLVESFPVQESLAPGQSFRQPIVRRLPELEAAQDNALHPVKIQLEEGGVPIAAIRTNTVFIVERPLLPLNVSLTFVLDAPVRTRPDGTFTSSDLEEQIMPEGRLESLVTVLEEAPFELTLVIAPLLLTQLEEMTDGYRVAGSGGEREVGEGEPETAAAASILERLSDLARQPTTEVLTLPYARPSIPALVAAGLEEDLTAQLAAGHEEIERLLEAEAETEIFRPSGSRLSPDAIEALEREGIETLILDAGTIPPEEDLLLSPPATTSLAAGDGEVIAVTPDLSLEARIERDLPEDLQLGAQWVLHELSMIYFEQPSVARGAAIVVDLDEAPPAGFLGAFVRGLEIASDGGWLRPRKAAGLVSAVDPLDRRRLSRSEIPTYSAAFLSKLRRVREIVANLQETAVETDLPGRLETLLLVAEARDFLTREDEALSYLDAAEERVGAEFSKVEPPEGTSVTLTSQDGVIPLTIRNLSDFSMRVRIRLLSSGLEFRSGSTRQVVLSRQAHGLTFPVRAQRTGRFPVTIRIETPDGTEMIAESQIVVRSTAYNRAALLVTIGAALFLALWWGRRFLRRRTS